MYIYMYLYIFIYIFYEESGGVDSSDKQMPDALGTETMSQCEGGRRGVRDGCEWLVKFEVAVGVH